jgi:hypothetical protein
MPRNRLGAEQIVTKLRQIEVMQGQSKSIASACKNIGIPPRDGPAEPERHRGGQPIDPIALLHWNVACGSHAPRFLALVGHKRISSDKVILNGYLLGTYNC